MIFQTLCLADKG